MVGFCHLTDSHHYHHGQKPTMVGICHGGNMPVGQAFHRDISQVEKHEEICLKTGQKKRKAFDMTKARVKVGKNSCICICICLRLLIRH